MSDFSIGGQQWPDISKLIEECGEVGQVCGKLIGARGVEAHWDGSNLRARLQDELGDLIAAIRFVADRNELDAGVIADRTAKKLNQFNVWHEAQE